MAVYVLNLHKNDNKDSWYAKSVVNHTSMQYVSSYKVPKGARFSNRPSEYDEFMPIQMGSLQNIGMDDKLLIFAHGSPSGVGPYCVINSPATNAQALVTDLKKWGLQSCGFISFKSCSLGAEGFLDQVRYALLTDQIDFGWLKGYTNSIWVMPRYVVGGKPMTNIVRKKTPTAALPGDTTKYRVLLIRGPSYGLVTRPNTQHELEV